LAVEFHQKSARIQTATRREFSQRHCGAHLPRVAVNENAQASMDRFRHDLISHKRTRETQRFEKKGKKFPQSFSALFVFFGD
jgi:hypothetical protein